MRRWSFATRCRALLRLLETGRRTPFGIALPPRPIFLFCAAILRVHRRCSLLSFERYLASGFGASTLLPSLSAVNVVNPTSNAIGDPTGTDGVSSRISTPTATNQRSASQLIVAFIIFPRNRKASRILTQPRPGMRIREPSILN